MSNWTIYRTISVPIHALQSRLLIQRYPRKKYVTEPRKIDISPFGGNRILGAPSSYEGGNPTLLWRNEQRNGACLLSPFPSIAHSIIDRFMARPSVLPIYPGSFGVSLPCTLITETDANVSFPGAWFVQFTWFVQLKTPRKVLDRILLDIICKWASLWNAVAVPTS